MAIRISKTGAIYYDASFTQERPQSASCANPTAEAVADGWKLGATPSLPEQGRLLAGALNATAAGTSTTEMATASLDHLGRSPGPPVPVRKSSPCRRQRP